MGDKYTWTIDFDVTNVKRSPVPDFVLEYASFQIWNTQNTYASTSPDVKNQLAPYEVRCERFVNPVLMHKYTHGGWKDDVGKKLDQLARIELLKLPQVYQPGDYDSLLRTRIGHNSYYDLEFPKPDSWTYYDSEMPEWIDAWDEKRLAREREEPTKPFSQLPA